MILIFFQFFVSHLLVLLQMHMGTGDNYSISALLDNNVTKLKKA